MAWSSAARDLVCEEKEIDDIEKHRPKKTKNDKDILATERE